MITIEIQKMLKELGFYNGAIDGISGALTDAAVKNFQKSKKMRQDGIVGALTILRLKETFEARLKESEHVKINRIFGQRGRNQILLKLPYPMFLAWDKSTKISSFLCNEGIKDALYNIFSETLAFYGAERVTKLNLDKFGGCFNIRNKRGGNTPSLHSWGIAVDLDPEHNQLKWGADKAAFARPEYRPFWDFVYKNGAYSLGLEKGYDFMHFQFWKP